MRRLIAAAGLAAALLVAGHAAPAAAQHPFCGSGEEFAHEHIVVLAESGTIGPEQGGGVHNPGGHRGFAVCDPPPGD